jgi:hypothetical protein
LLQVQRAQLEIHHQHDGQRIGLDDLLCIPHANQSGLAPHEADQCTLHVWRQTCVAEHVDVQSRRIEAGATRDN